MNRIATLLLGLALCAPAAAETGFLDRSVTVQGKTHQYQVYVPLDYTPAKLWPVIVYLHGNGHQGSDGMRQTNAAFANAVRENRSLFPAIVVCPQAATGEAWFSANMQDLVMEELDHAIAEFHGDPAKLYLTGFSMGGSGAYRIAAHHPNKFSALLVVAGRIQPSPRHPAADNEIDRSANPFVAAPDPFAALAAQIKGIPIWIFHGDSDEAVAVEQSRQLVAALKAQNADVKYTEYPGANHTEAAEKAYTDAATIPWLFQHQKPAVAISGRHSQ